MKPLALVLLTALLSVLVYPQFELTFLAPLCLIPMLVSAAQEPCGWKRALYGQIGGMFYWCGICYWIADVLKLYGGMKASDAKQLRLLQEENRRLKKAVADLTLEKQILKEVAEGNF